MISPELPRIGAKAPMDSKLKLLTGVGWIIVSIGVSVALVFLVACAPSRGNTLIEILKILLSWPVVIALLCFCFGITFRKEIAKFMVGIVEIRFPGGGIRAIQPPPPGDEEPAPASANLPEGTITLNKDQVALIRNQLDGLAKQAADAHQQKEQILDGAAKRLVEERRVATYWFFRYLSVFLVPMTQRVLEWFDAREVAPTKEFYDQEWRPWIPDQKQRETIFMVLLHHGLLEARGPVIGVTQAGRDFLAFLHGKNIFAEG